MLQQAPASARVSYSQSACVLFLLLFLMPLGLPRKSRISVPTAAASLLQIERFIASPDIQFQILQLLPNIIRVQIRFVYPTYTCLPVSWNRGIILHTLSLDNLKAHNEIQSFVNGLCLLWGSIWHLSPEIKNYCSYYRQISLELAKYRSSKFFWGEFEETLASQLFG